MSTKTSASNSWRHGIVVARSWFQPQRRAALVALAKAALLVGCLWEAVWFWHVEYYSRRYPEVPLSLAWSMLSVIGGIVFAQMGCSAVLKLRSTRLSRLSAESKARLTAMLTAYITVGDWEAELIESATTTPRDFEECLTAALIGTRGFALDRLRELPGVDGLRDGWIRRSQKGGTLHRRYAVEHLGLLRDPAAVEALELALEDPDAGVVAAAVRGLLRIPSYHGREGLVRSLPGRPYLIRVLTAGEDLSIDEAIAAPQPAGRPRAFAAAASAGPIRPTGMPELQMRAARNSGMPDPERDSCSTLASLGSSGQDLLRLMSATGVAGEAPAEALGESLTAAARGGRG